MATWDDLKRDGEQLKALVIYQALQLKTQAELIATYRAELSRLTRESSDYEALLHRKTEECDRYEEALRDCEAAYENLKPEVEAVDDES